MIERRAVQRLAILHKSIALRYVYLTSLTLGAIVPKLIIVIPTAILAMQYSNKTIHLYHYGDLITYL